MAIVINGSGTVTGLAVGGLPDGTVDAGTLATDSVTAAKLEVSAITNADLPAGSVLQVVSANGGILVQSTSSSFIDAGLSATITPSSTSSKILIIVDQLLAADSAGWWAGYGIYRGSTSIKGTSYELRNGGSHIHSRVSLNYLDSPSTTSATTYKTMFRRTSGSTASVNDNSAPSTITLMEVAG